jgi:fructose-specific phosphotransferase system IIC component
MAPPTVNFAPSANQAVVSAYTRQLVRRLLQAAGCPGCTITSTSRTPAEQARAMYKNVQSLGVTSQLALYADAGDAVINEYVKARKAGLAPASIIAAMSAKIVEVGPERVSLHCADPARLNVIDIAPSSIADPGAFIGAIAAAKQQGTISRFFTPGDHDPAFHIEVPQP